MFVDASAICAILLQEPDGKELILRLGETSDRLTSPMSVWESVIVLANRGALSVRDAHGMVTDLLALAEIKLVAVPPETAAVAVEAFERYGKGRHPAALNFGDCFSYACARHFRVPLLYKGDDFGRTDIETAAIGD